MEFARKCCMIHDRAAPLANSLDLPMRHLPGGQCKQTIGDPAKPDNAKPMPIRAETCVRCN